MRKTFENRRFSMLQIFDLQTFSFASFDFVARKISFFAGSQKFKEFLDYESFIRKQFPNLDLTLINRFYLKKEFCKYKNKR